MFRMAVPAIAILVCLVIALVSVHHYQLVWGSKVCNCLESRSSLCEEKRLDEGDGPAIEIVFPSARELGIAGRLVSAQLFVETPFGKVEISDAVIDLLRGIARIHVDTGVFAEVLRLWNMVPRTEQVEIPLEVDLWYQDANGSIHRAFTVVHWSLQEMKLLRRDTVLRIYPLCTILDPYHNLFVALSPLSMVDTGSLQIYHAIYSKPLLCKLEWRLSTGVFDGVEVSEDLIPILAIDNVNGSSKLSLGLYLKNFEVGYSIIVGETGSRGLRAVHAYTGFWGLRLHSVELAREGMAVPPGYSAILFIRGRMSIDIYREHIVCIDPESSRVITDLDTSIFKIETGISYIETDSRGKIITAIGMYRKSLDMRMLPKVCTELDYGDTAELMHYLFKSSKSVSPAVAVPIGLVIAELYNSTGVPIDRDVLKKLLVPIGSTVAIPVANLGPSSTTLCIPYVQNTSVALISCTTSSGYEMG